MIFYLENNVNLNDQYEEILRNINFHINYGNKNFNILMDCLNNITNVVNSNNVITNTDTIVSFLDSISSISALIKDDINSLNSMKDILTNLFSNTSDENSFTLTDENKSMLLDFNKSYIELKAKLFESYNMFSEFIQKYINCPIIFSNNTTNTVCENVQVLDDSVKKSTEDSSTFEDIKDNKTLLISEKENKVFLPYSVSDLNDILKNNSNYKSLKEIIDSEYIFPLSKFNNPIISRFRETYNLMKKKEKASIFESLDLALELAFNSLLNPAIISACKNLDELDIYLDYLESNELEKFDVFEIKYDFLPRKTAK